MMKIFICPRCGRMTAASRRKELFCSKCEEFPMESVKLTFEKYTQMDEKQRQDYSVSWRYIHSAAKR